MFRIFASVFISSLIYPIAVALILTYAYNIHSLDVSRVLLVNFFIASSLHIMLRTGVKGIYYQAKHQITGDQKKVLIYGSDNKAVLIKQALFSGNQFIFEGFVEADLKKVNRTIQQGKVYHKKDLAKLKANNKIDILIIVNEQLENKNTQEIIEACLKLGIRILTVPPSEQWISGKLSLKQLQELKIENLLQREPIVINNSLISGEIRGKRILITGAAGSIGSEIVRQVLTYDPEMVILCDQAESALYEIQLEMEERFPNADIKIFIGNIRNYKRLQIIFNECRPQIIFHAAAYKHVPMMERHPSEAIFTNVMGSKIVADLAVLYKAEKFVMISTDKAVNPTNVMGASKRIAEIYVQSRNTSVENVDATSINESSSRTKFITTRFGNVLGSNGSVIPRFRDQIIKGGPVTVTDKEITRYFMTIPEAVQLVLEAGTMGEGGEIFIFDMGKPVKINDLAINMIKLAGLVPNKDIKIVYTGLRPGEKLYEELLNEKEQTIPTHHEKIKIAKVRTCSYGQILADIQELITICELDDHSMLVKKMKEIVPEFKSKNSEFEKLDLLNVDSGKFFNSELV
ncbi:MAG TPA: nucleoside-diphosphate sugar epimerase/dehydratase [Flavitalea sp.]|nr:nucleoside-diphosphate sugar epimerase/dehydratase [Flavitalea sp.]